MVLKRLRKFMERWQKPHKPSKVEVKRQRHLGADYEDTMMAVTFAEAGAPEQALEFLSQRGNRKILVLGQEDTFTEPVMEYATLLAERLGYDLVALSVGNAPSGKFRRLSVSICKKNSSAKRRQPRRCLNKKRLKKTSAAPMW